MEAMDVVQCWDCGSYWECIFMWNDSIAKEGGEEIGSCLLKYITCMNITSYIFRQLWGKTRTRIL